MKSKVKDKLVGIYAPGSYGTPSYAQRTSEKDGRRLVKL